MKITINQQIVANIYSNPNFYHIPAYQRAFTWQMPQLEQFYDDICENDKGYFLGSIITIKENSENADQSPPKTLIIDGQQRMTTIYLILVALHKHLSDTWKEKRGVVGEESIEEIEDLHRYMVFIEEHLIGDKKKRLTLSIENNNDDDLISILVYQSALNKSRLAAEYQSSKESPRYTRKRIYNTYNHFLKVFREDLTDHKKINDFYEKITQANLVNIITESASDAYTLFESVNNRGVQLSPIDLIKNYSIKYLEKDFLKEGGADAINENWKILKDNIEEPSDQIRYMRHFYHVFRELDNNITLTNYSKATKSNIIKIYEDLLKKEDHNKYIFNKLIEKSRLYNLLSKPDNIEQNGATEDLEQLYKKYSTILMDLNRLETSPVRALLLFLFSKYNYLDHLKTLQYIEKWYLRRQITNYPPTNRLDIIFQSLINNIQSKDKASSLNSEELFELVKNELENEKASDDLVLSMLEETDIYHNRTTRYLLIKLEESLRDDREEKLDFWSEEKNKPIWTIEHILPQNPNKNSDWLKIFSTKDEVEDFCHRIGNLTLTAYNSNLSNAEFKVKKENENGFNTGRLKINDYVKNQNEWNQDKIYERTQLLIETILEKLL